MRLRHYLEPGGSKSAWLGLSTDRPVVLASNPGWGHLQPLVPSRDACASAGSAQQTIDLPE